MSFALIENNHELTSRKQSSAEASFGRTHHVPQHFIDSEIKEALAYARASDTTAPDNISARIPARAHADRERLVADIHGE